MLRRIATSLPILLLALTGPLQGSEQPKQPEQPASPEPKVEKLGDQRYRIGSIEIDGARHRFTVPGVVLRDEPPLEFLAVMSGGFKAYESLLELSASAYEFNAACLLLGLDPEKGRDPSHHFDPKPLEGDPVEIWVSWTVDDRVERVNAADLIVIGEKTLPRGDWTYTGSVFTPDGQYFAQLDGTLVGFVHAPASIVGHRTGFGLGNYGAVAPNNALLPPVGTAVTFILERSKE